MQQASKAHTPNECAELEERRNVLRRRLKSWMESRNLYIPLIAEDFATTSSTESSHAMSADHPPEAMSLGLPSTLAESLLQNSGTFNLVEIELRFRLAQADESLSELRRLLRVTMGLTDYKSKQIGPSQRAGTRARNLINRFRDKVSRCAERYKAARNALLALDPQGKWKIRLLQLKDEDIRTPGRGEDESEGFREVPWIWRGTRQNVPQHDSSLEQIRPLSDEEFDDCEDMN